MLCCSPLAFGSSRATAPPQRVRHVDHRSRRKFGKIATLRGAVRDGYGILDRAVVPATVAARVERQSAIPLSKSVSCLRDSKRSRSRCGRRTTKEKFRAQMEL